jgi:hypothetical protein
MKTISFNTGRSYSAHGQRIAAGQLDDGRVVFVDIDRGLDYVTSAPCALEPRAIMRAYDYNETDGTHAAADDYDARVDMLRELEALAAKL